MRANKNKEKIYNYVETLGESIGREEQQLEVSEKSYETKRVSLEAYRNELAAQILLQTQPRISWKKYLFTWKYTNH